MQEEWAPLNGYMFNGCYQCYQEGTWSKRLLCNQASMILRLSPCEFIELVCTSLRTPSVSFATTELPTFVWRELRAAKRSVTCSFRFGSGKNDLFPTVLAIRVFSRQLFWKFLVDLQVGDSHLQFLQGFLLQAILDKSLAGCGSMNQPIDMTCTAVEAPSHQRGHQSCVEWHLSGFISACFGWSSFYIAWKNGILSCSPLMLTYN